MNNNLEPTHTDAYFLFPNPNDRHRQRYDRIGFQLSTGMKICIQDKRFYNSKRLEGYFMRVAFEQVRSAQN